MKLIFYTLWFTGSRKDCFLFSPMYEEAQNDANEEASLNKVKSPIM